MLRKIIGAAVLFSVMLPSVRFAVAETPQERMGTISGQVVHEGNSLPNVLVAFFDAGKGLPPIGGEGGRIPDGILFADSEGKFSVSLNEGSYYLGALVRKSGPRLGPPREGEPHYLAGDGVGGLRKLDVMASRRTDYGPVDFATAQTFEEKEGTFRIEGTVFRGSKGNAPFPGAIVLAKTSRSQFRRPEYASAETGADGKFSLALRSGPTYYLVARTALTGMRPRPGDIIGRYSSRPGGGSAEGAEAAATPPAGGLASNESLPVSGEAGRVISGIEIRMYDMPVTGPVVPQTLDEKDEYSAFLKSGPGVLDTQRPGSRFEDTNVILVTLQCLRLDHMGIGGYGRDTTPHLDQIAESSVLFENSIGQTNLTPVAMMSALTGKYPRVNGMVAFDVSEDSVPGRTLPEILKYYDYKTAAVLTSPEFFLRFDGRSGNSVHLRDVFSRSFDEYLWPRGRAGRSLREVPTRSLDWLGENRGEKFFLWIADGSMHPPYAANVPEPDKSIFDPPDYTPFWTKFFPIVGSKAGPDDPSIERFLRVWDDRYYMGFEPVHQLAPEDRAYIVGRYDAGVRYADKFVGALEEKLKDTGLDKKTIVIYYSIHGKTLGEKGQFINYDLYDPAIRNVLMISFPDGMSAGRRISEQVQGIDLMPTLLDYLGIPVAADLQGVNLMPLIRGEEGARGSEYMFIDRIPYFEHWMSRFLLEFKFQDPLKRSHPPSEDKKIGAYVEMLGRAFPFDAYPAGDIAVRTNRWKLIVRKNPQLLEKVSWPAFITGTPVPVEETELYDLAADPLEERNVVADYPAVVEELRARLMAWDAENEKAKVPYYRPGEKRYLIPYPGEP